jgi:hypothetical protein
MIVIKSVDFIVKENQKHHEALSKIQKKFIWFFIMLVFIQKLYEIKTKIFKKWFFNIKPDVTFNDL